MINAATPPGTEIVCIDDAPGRYGHGGLRRGAHYTVDHVEKSITGEHCVLLAEIASWHAYDIGHGIVDVGFDLRRFRYLEDLSLFENLLTQAIKELERAA